MSVVNHERRFVYLFEPHTASRATADALVKHVTGSTNYMAQHAPLNVIPHKPDYKIIVTCRNPYSVMVTQWHHHQYDKKRTFEVFVRDYWDNPLGAANYGLWKSATHFCRYETLQSDLHVMFGSGMNLEYNDKHRTLKKKEWRLYYTPELYERFLAREDWKAYMTRFGYVGSACVLLNHFGSQ